MLRHLLPVLGLLTLAACGQGEEAGAGGAMPPPEVGVIIAQGRQRAAAARTWSAAWPRSAAPTCAPACRACCSSASTRKAATCKRRPGPVPDRSGAAAGRARPEPGAAGAGAGHLRQCQGRRRPRAPAGAAEVHLRSPTSTTRSPPSAAPRPRCKQARPPSTAPRINLGYATVRAPISGRAGKQQVTEGALVGQGNATLLTTVDQIDPLYVNFSMSVTELEQIRRARRPAPAPARREVAGGAARRHAVRSAPGTLDFSGDVGRSGHRRDRAARAHPQSRQARCCPAPTSRSRPRSASRHNAFLVPQAGVQRDAKSAYVLVVGSDGKVARKDVVADRQQGANWIVSKRPGRRRPGDRVRPAACAGRASRRRPRRGRRRRCGHAGPSAGSPPAARPGAKAHGAAKGLIARHVQILHQPSGLRLGHRDPDHRSRGVLAIFNLGVESYPSIAPPQVTVSARPTRAPAPTPPKRAVTQVIEQQLTGIDNLRLLQLLVQFQRRLLDHADLRARHRSRTSPRCRCRTRSRWRRRACRPK